MKKAILCLLFIFLILIDKTFTQNLEPANHRLKVYIDCFKGCDMTFIRTEINIVDFMLDRLDADVHILINDQNTGGGGDEYQIIFLGKNQFKDITDTVRFINHANNTKFEERDLVIKYLKLGLIQFLSKSNLVDDIVISLKSDKEKSVPDNNNSENSNKDPWNYWVLRMGLSGNSNLDAVYKSLNLNGNFSANRITEEMKFGFSASTGKSSTIYNLEDDNGNKVKISNKNNEYYFNQYYVKSLGNHFAWGLETGLSRSTFTNNKNKYRIETGIEYNFFPYKEVNTRFFVVSYRLDARHNIYFDTTLYEKTKETLWGQGVEVQVSLNQKWGTVSVGADYHNYLHNWKYFNLGINGLVELRISGGLSCFINSSAKLTRDQLFLPKRGATQEDVLTRRRQLASGYDIRTKFGINYRFGSKLNNFVNPRFDF